MNKIRVAIADDHQMVREGLRLLLESIEDIEVVSEASDGNEALEHVATFLPDVVILDLQMPKLDGLAVTKIVRRDYPQVNVIVLTVHAEEEYVEEAMNLGASGYILKEIPKSELVSIIHRVAQGQTYIHSKVTRALLAQLKKAKSRKMLRPAEEELLWLLAEGLSDEAIAEMLDVSVGTVEKRVERLIGQLEAGDRAQRMAMNLRDSLVGGEHLKHEETAGANRPL